MPVITSEQQRKHKSRFWPRMVVAFGASMVALLILAFSPWICPINYESSRFGKPRHGIVVLFTNRSGGDSLGSAVADLYIRMQDRQVFHYWRFGVGSPRVDISFASARWG